MSTLNLTPLCDNWDAVTQGDTYPAQRYTVAGTDSALTRVRCKVKNRTGTTLLNLDSNTSGITITTATAGAWDFTIAAISAATMEGIEEGNHFYDIETTDAAGTVLTDFRGSWQILSQQTDAS
jgi:hypothetical protein